MLRLQNFQPQLSSNWCSGTLQPEFLYKVCHAHRSHFCRMVDVKWHPVTGSWWYGLLLFMRGPACRLPYYLHFNNVCFILFFSSLLEYCLHGNFQLLESTVTGISFLNQLSGLIREPVSEFHPHCRNTNVDFFKANAPI